MPEPDDNKEIEYVKGLARRAFRNVTRMEDTAIDNIERQFSGTEKKVLTKSPFTGIGLGIAAGIIVCVAAMIFGIPFGRTEAVFITAQFGLLGALMSHLNS